jgi:arsenite oxidase small subunit
MKRCESMVAIGHRRFLAGVGVAATGAAAAQFPVKRAKAAPAGGVDYPSTRLANVRDLKIDQPLNVTLSRH